MRRSPHVPRRHPGTLITTVGRRLGKSKVFFARPWAFLVSRIVPTKENAVVRIAGIGHTSPAQLRLDLDHIREERKHRWRPLLVDADMPLTPKRITYKTKFALAMGVSVLAQNKQVLAKTKENLSLLVADSPYLLEHTGIPLLDDKSRDLATQSLLDWFMDGEDPHIGLDDVRLGSLSHKRHIDERLKTGSKSAAGMMLEITLPIPSKKNKALARKLFLDWLAEPRAKTDELAEALAPYVEESDIKEQLEVLASREFGKTKRFCERMIGTARSNRDPDAIQKWIKRNTGEGKTAEFDANYLLTVYQNTGA